MTLNKVLPLAGLLFLTFSLRASATTTVLGDGGNLSAAIAAANNLDVIELASNGSFSGNLNWTNKYLTIRAAAGFQPTIQGSISQISGNSSTGGTFSGLNITGGINVVSNATTFANYLVQDTTFQGSSTLSGTGNFALTAVFERSQFLNSLQLGGTGAFSSDVTMNGNVFKGSVILDTLGTQEVMNAKFNDNDFFTRPITGGGPISTDHRTLTFSRNRLRQGIDIAVGDFNFLTLAMSDNMLGQVNPQFPIATPGILIRPEGSATSAHVNLSFTNDTVTGFATGIEFQEPAPGGTATFRNMLLKNVDDLVDVPVTIISNSLISDGTYNGQANNFAGTPLLDSDGRLLAGSPGIDRGNNAFASSLDLAKNARIFDGNGDGVKTVDVGAYEFVPEPAGPMLAIIALAVLSLPARTQRSSHCTKSLGRSDG